MRTPSVLAALLLLAPWPDVAGQHAPVTLDRIAQWGCGECTTGHQFGGIEALAVTLSGNTYLIDRDEPRVRIFDTTGAMIRAFGRRGRGPGELEVPVGIAIVRDGSMQIPDLRNARMTRYSATGALVATVPLTRVPTAMAHHPSRSEVLVAFTDFRRGGEIERWLPSDSAGRLLVELSDFPPTEGVPGTVHSFAADPAGGFVVGDGINEYRIRRFGPDGRAAGADIVRDIARVAKTDEEIAQHEAQMASRGAQMRAALEARSGGRSGDLAMPAVPRLRNHFDYFALRIDSKGRVWVRTARAAVGRTIFDVFDSRGGFLGEVELPLPVRGYDVAGEFLVTASEGRDGEPIVVLWRTRHEPGNPE